MSRESVPIFIISRDRLSSLIELASWLLLAGHDEIYIVDNSSTYPPLVKWLDETDITVVRLAENHGPLAPFIAGVVAQYAANRRFVITDPDVIPTEESPLDAISYFSNLLDRYPDIVKVGFGLRIDDLPNRYRARSDVIAHEGQFWSTEVEPGVYIAPIDTTFAIYRAGTPFVIKPALRTGAPYLARHLPWYADSSSPTAEQLYYEQHSMKGVVSWHFFGMDRRYRWQILRTRHPTLAKIARNLMPTFVRIGLRRVVDGRSD
jgi:hypothetical protein